MADSSVRRARLIDVEELARIQFDSWPLTPGLPEAAKEVLDLAEVTRAWERAVVAPPSERHTVWIALAEATIVGLVALAPVSDPDLTAATTSELLTLVVAPSARGQGHGSRLLNAAVDALREQQQEAVVVWLNTADDHTRAFLEASGWAPDGAFRTLAMVEGEPESGSLRQIRLGTDLTVEASDGDETNGHES